MASRFYPYIVDNYTSAATYKTPIIKSSAATTIKTVTCPGINFIMIPTQAELQEEQEKKRREEKLRLKVNRKAMFSKKGR